MSLASTNSSPRTWSAEQYKVLFFAAGAVVGAVLLRAYAPATLHMPPCPFHLLTGLYCPGCGATRALHHLLNFEFAAALHCNLLFVLASPFLASWLAIKGLRVLRIWNGPTFTLSNRDTWLLAVVILTWFIVRNLPFACFAIPLQ